MLITFLMAVRKYLERSNLKGKNLFWLMVDTIQNDAEGTVAGTRRLAGHTASPEAEDKQEVGPD